VRQLGDVLFEHLPGLGISKRSSWFSPIFFARPGKCCRRMVSGVLGVQYEMNAHAFPGKLALLMRLLHDFTSNTT